MGTQLGPIIVSHEIKTEDLANKKFAVDSFNMLYQFLTTIRQQDGNLLTDSKGRVTSHLSGLFFRVSNLMKHNMKLAFVFDGISPELKREEKERRAEIKQESEKRYKEAAEQGDIELMKKYASRTARLSKEMVEESKELITYLGIPIIQAPSEGEAQAAHMVKKGEFYGLLSQDTDGLLFGSPKLIRNLSVSKKRKKQGTSAYETVNPEIIDLTENLNTLGVDRDQLIIIGMLCGTDFNIGGVKGIGPKKALSLVKKHSKDFKSLFAESGWDFYTPWEEVFRTIKEMPVTDNYTLKWSLPDKNKLFRLLVEEHDFSRERVEKALEGMKNTQAQKGLSEFL